MSAVDDLARYPPPRRVLLVFDSDTNRKLIGDLLEAKGYEIVEMPTKPDLIVTDDIGGAPLPWDDVPIVRVSAFAQRRKP